MPSHGRVGCDTPPRPRGRTRSGARGKRAPAQARPTSRGGLPCGPATTLAVAATGVSRTAPDRPGNAGMATARLRSRPLMRLHLGPIPSSGRIGGDTPPRSVVARGPAHEEGAPGAQATADVRWRACGLPIGCPDPPVAIAADVPRRAAIRLDHEPGGRRRRGSRGRAPSACQCEDGSARPMAGERAGPGVANAARAHEEDAAAPVPRPLGRRIPHARGMRRDPRPSGAAARGRPGRTATHRCPR